MNQVNVISKTQESNLQQDDSQNRFEICEEIVDALVEKGLPKIYNPSNFINRIAQEYGISTQEARTCLKLAVNQLETQSKEKNANQEEERYAQCGYFYPSLQNSPKIQKKKDGMDSLSSLGNYNRLMFGLR